MWISRLKKRTQKGHLSRHIKRPVLLHFGGREAGAGSAAVSSHWSGQRGESPMLHHSDGCVQLHYIWAAGSPGCRGRGSHCLAPLAKGFRPRLTGQGLVRTQAWLGLAGQRGAAVVSQMIYRGGGWRDYWKDTFYTGQFFSPNNLLKHNMLFQLSPTTSTLHELFTWAANL